MNAVWIMHDIVLEDEITEILDELKIVGFSRWTRMTGRGPKSGSRMDNHVWPGANAGAVVMIEPAVAEKLMARLQTLRDTVGTRTGLWAFTTPVLSALK